MRGVGEEGRSESASVPRVVVYCRKGKVGEGAGFITVLL